MIQLDAEQERRVQRLHRDGIVIDTMASGPALFTAGLRTRIRSGLAAGKTAIDVIAQLQGPTVHELATNAGAREQYLIAWDAAGVTCVSDTQGGLGTPPFSFESGLSAIAHTTRLIDALQDHLVRVTRAQDIRRAKQDGKHGVLLNFQNTTHFGLEWDRLELFYDLRAMMAASAGIRRPGSAAQGGPLRPQGLRGRERVGDGVRARRARAQGVERRPRVGRPARLQATGGLHTHLLPRRLAARPREA